MGAAWIFLVGIGFGIIGFGMIGWVINYRFLWGAGMSLQSPAQGSFCHHFWSLKNDILNEIQIL